MTAENWQYQEAMEAAAAKGAALDENRGVEVQTDKDAIKVVPCRGCARPLVVNTFYAASKARCTECRAAGGTGRGSSDAPVPGKTDPAKARRLEDCLVNHGFAHAQCPVDAEHDMELKSVSHSQYYGPKPRVPGETVMFQCRECRATVSYSTTAQQQFRRQNEPDESGSKQVNGWAEILGTREED
jgi:hypothetical protein